MDEKEIVNMKNKETIVILGGMGPEASAYMYRMLIDLSIKYFGAKNNDDFPDIVLFSVPVPDFISNSKNLQKALGMLQDKIKVINKINVGCIAIACNTAHILLPDLQAVSNIPFVSMVDAVVAKVRKNKCKRIGLLATPSTIKSQIYQKALAFYAVETILPNEKEIGKLEIVIRNVIEGKSNRNDSNKLKKIANRLVEQGAQGIILGCTELSMVFPSNFHVSFYNSLEILSMALLKRYYGTCRIEI